MAARVHSMILHETRFVLGHFNWRSGHFVEQGKSDSGTMPDPLITVAIFGVFV